MPALPALMLGLFALTLFVSASLLFLVEPMVGKMMLPLLGGTPAVWNTCMVFFQAVLLAGYGYAHATTAWLGPRRQALLHLGVLTLPFLFFLVNGPLAIDERWISGNEGNPIPALLVVLTISVGVPMFVVCSSAPLLQTWFSTTDHPSARDPYFLYGASNLGSMLALVGYPALVEPFLTLRVQRVEWAMGYGILAALTALCAWAALRSRPAPVLVPAGTEGARQPEESAHAAMLAGVPAEVGASEAFKPASREIARDKARLKKKGRLDRESGPVAETGYGEAEATADYPVTWLRRLRWILLAAVPSSMMLGVTTYITTDIAAIPLLWVLPLALYLLTFILVFAKMSARFQSVVLFVGILASLLVTGIWLAPLFFSDEQDTMLWIVRVALVVPALCSLLLLQSEDTRLIHRSMVLIMPLLVLLLIFMILSELRPGKVWMNIGVHVLTLFVVSMVCHGELALDRPTPKHLTEFFLWMSFGGVVGGLFNALVAPLVFNAIVEYQLMMVVACLLVPPLGSTKTSSSMRLFDLILLGAFVVIGGLLAWSSYSDPEPKGLKLDQAPWVWSGVAVLGALALCLLSWFTSWSGPVNSLHGPAGVEDSSDTWVDRALDLAMPAALLALMFALYFGISSTWVHSKIRGLLQSYYAMRTGETDVEVPYDVQRTIRLILQFGIPAVLAYTFVDRWLRFGLGVGAVLLGAGFCAVLADPALFQDRSFFGVLKVEQSFSRLGDREFEVRRLVHGTTLHGKQFMIEELQDEPLTYYHKTGPIGRIFDAYNDASKPVGVIGLGTGTMACYAKKGQKMTFYDIDPIVKRISFDDGGYFTFVSDAIARGADIVRYEPGTKRQLTDPDEDLVLGDARLTLKRKLEAPLLNERGEVVKDEAGQPVRKFQEKDRYSLLVVDAFSSDAIPVHLITSEALQLYMQAVREDGIVCFHISNRYLDLHPVLANLAVAHGLAGFHLSDDDEEAPGKTRSHWVVLAKDKKHMQKLLKGPSSDDPLSDESGWEPLETMEELERQHPLRQQQVADAEKAIAAAKKDVESAEKAVTAAKEDAARAEEKAAPTDLKAEKYKAFQEEQKKKVRAKEVAKEKADKDYLSKEQAKAGYRYRLRKVEEKLQLTPKVGVWSDDYSNLLSVFSW